MSGFFGGGSAGSFLLASTGLGELVTEVEDADLYAFNLAGALSLGRVLRIRYALRWETDDSNGRFILFTLNTDNQGGLFEMSTQTDAAADFGAVPAAVFFDIYMLPNPAPGIVGGSTTELRTAQTVSGEGGDPILVTATQFNHNAGFDPTTVNTFTLSTELADDLPGLSVQLMYATVEILRAP